MSSPRMRRASSGRETTRRRSRRRGTSISAPGSRKTSGLHCRGLMRCRATEHRGSGSIGIIGAVRSALLDGPERIAPQVPVADEEADRPPGLGRVRRPPVAAEVAHRLLVGREARVRLEVLGLPRPEDQAFGLERGPVEVHAYALAWARAGRSTPSRDGSLQRFAGRSPHHGPRGDLTHAQGSPYRGHPSQLPPHPAAAVSARLAVLPSAVQREIRQRSKRRRLASLHAYTLCTFRLEDAPAFLDTAGITEISMATAPAMALLRQWQLLSTFLT